MDGTPVRAHAIHIAGPLRVYGRIHSLNVEQITSALCNGQAQLIFDPKFPRNDPTP